MMEIKMALVKVISKYRFKPAGVIINNLVILNLLVFINENFSKSLLFVSVKFPEKQF